MLVCFDFEKVNDISGNFLEILGNFSKKIAGHKTPDFESFRKLFLENGIKHYLWGGGDIKLQKFWGAPKLPLKNHLLYPI